MAGYAHCRHPRPRYPKLVSWSRRSRILVFLATVVVGDALFLIVRLNRDVVYAQVTYVGIDSFSIRHAQLMDPASLLNALSPPVHADANIVDEEAARQQKPIKLIRLTSKTTFGEFLALVRKLKAQKVCNVFLLNREIRS
jgi:hypothetical protein